MSLADENGVSFWLPEFDHADRPDRLERVGHACAVASTGRRVFTAADPDQVFAA